jgi:hypothetical protein
VTSLLISSNILLSRLSQFTDETVGDNQCGFRHNRLTTDQIFCISQILEEKMEVQYDSTSAIHRLQESISFSEEGSIVQYSHRVWGTHETQ